MFKESKLNTFEIFCVDVCLIAKRKSLIKLSCVLYSTVSTANLLVWWTATLLCAHTVILSFVSCVFSLLLLVLLRFPLECVLNSLPNSMQIFFKYMVHGENIFMIFIINFLGKKFIKFNQNSFFFLSYQAK